MILYMLLRLLNNIKRFLFTSIFKPYKKSALFTSLNQNTCTVYDAQEIKKQEQKEAIEKLYIKKALTKPN